jgi:hypothetical protein
MHGISVGHLSHFGITPNLTDEPQRGCSSAAALLNQEAPTDAPVLALGLLATDTELVLTRVAGRERSGRRAQRGSLWLLPPPVGVRRCLRPQLATMNSLGVIIVNLGNRVSIR